MDFRPVGHGIGYAVVQGVVVGFVFQSLAQVQPGGSGQPDYVVQGGNSHFIVVFRLGQGLLGVDQFHLGPEHVGFGHYPYGKLGLGVLQMFIQTVHGFLVQVHGVGGLEHIIVPLFRIVPGGLVGTAHPILVVVQVLFGLVDDPFQTASGIDGHRNAHLIGMIVADDIGLVFFCTAAGMGEINAPPPGPLGLVQFCLGRVQFSGRDLDAGVVVQGHADGFPQIQVYGFRGSGPHCMDRKGAQDDSAQNHAFGMEMLHNQTLLYFLTT